MLGREWDTSEVEDRYHQATAEGWEGPLRDRVLPADISNMLQGKTSGENNRRSLTLHSRGAKPDQRQPGRIPNK